MPRSGPLGLADNSKVDWLDVWYKSVNFGRSANPRLGSWVAICVLIRNSRSIYLEPGILPRHSVKAWELRRGYPLGPVLFKQSEKCLQQSWQLIQTSLIGGFLDE